MDTTKDNRAGRADASAVPDARRRRRLLRAGIATIGAMGLFAGGATLARGDITVANTGTLAAVGPVGAYGYPVWYEDSTGLRLEQCLDLDEQLCDPAFLVGEGVDPAQPLAIGDTAAESNWPLESFYFLGESGGDNTVGAGGSRLVLGLEATFANELPKNPDQVVFGRLRIRVDTPTAGTYTITHPYGEDTFVVSEADVAAGINFTEDITAAPGQFNLALGSRINPFLVSAGGTIQTATGTYVGDPAVTTAVTGSPHGTNFFRVDGPEPGVLFESDQFSLLGKVSTNSGLEGHSATYSEDASGLHLNVFASAGANNAVRVSGTGVPETTLTAGADGTSYFARVAIDSVPSEVTLTNASDVPEATKTLPVTDLVTMTGATYDTTAQTLTVSGTSSDTVGNTLQADPDGDGPIAAKALDASGVATFGPADGLSVPTPWATVTSAVGGTDTGPVSVTGGTVGTPYVPPVVGPAPEPLPAVPGPGTPAEPPTPPAAEPVDTLTVTSAELRTRRTDWRINGTSTIAGTNTVSVYLQNSDGTKGALVGTSPVDPIVAPATTGAWTVRGRNGTPPNGATQLIVESSAGGSLQNVTFTTRR